PRQDSRAFARDGLAIDWNQQIAQLHPPIPLIGRCLQKILEDKVQTAILITPDWRAQFWKPTLDRLTLQIVDLGPSHLILTPGKHMKQHGWILPPGYMIASVISQNQVKIKQERNYLEMAQTCTRPNKDCKISGAITSRNSLITQPQHITFLREQLVITDWLK
ncbi:MAG: hypothetical protein EZS28_030717, partial [Streblomastix strix]